MHARRRSRFSLLAFSLSFTPLGGGLGAACAPSTTPAPDAPNAPMPTTTQTTQAAHTAPTTVDAARAGVTWQADDWDESVRRAQREGKLLFVDGWAPWCHTCLSMKREVLEHPSLRAYEDAFVFVALDTDKPDNAAFTTRFAMSVWPSFFVIDPTSLAVVALQGGSMSLDETRAMLERARTSRSRPRDAGDEALAAGYAQLAQDPRGAARSFEAAIAATTTRRTEAVHAAVRAWRQASDARRCVELALQHVDTLAGSAAASDLCGWLTSCAEELDEKDPLRATAIGRATTRLRAWVSSPPTGASVDDRADALAQLADLEDGAGHADVVRALHEQRLQLLVDDANKATTPEGARVHDYARMNSLLALGRGDEAVALFRGRTTTFPDSYEAWARLGSTLHKLKRDDEAAAALGKAIALSYGPRRLRYLSTLVDVQDALGKSADATTSARRLVDEAAALPPALVPEGVVDAARKRLAKTTTPNTSSGNAP